MITCYLKLKGNSLEKYADGGIVEILDKDVTNELLISGDIVKVNSEGTEVEIKIDRTELEEYYLAHKDEVSVEILIRLNNINDLSQKSNTISLTLNNDIKLISIEPKEAKIGDTITLKGYGFITRNEGSTYINIGEIGVVSGKEISDIKIGEYSEPDIITFKLDTLTSIPAGNYKISISNSVSLFSNSLELKIIDESSITSGSRIKKTGQTKSYDKNGKEVKDGTIRDDGFYQIGIRHEYERDDSQEIVKDITTNLIWQDNIDVKNIKLSAEKADEYCSDLVLGDYTDWRVPNIIELQTLFYNNKIEGIFHNIHQ